MKLGIREWLFGLAMAAGLPVLLFASVAVLYLASVERAAMLVELERRTEAAARAVEGRLQHALNTAAVLADAPTLRLGDFRVFHEYATRVVTQFGSNIIVIDADGREILNTLRPFGEPLPPSEDPETLHKVFGGGKSYVSDLFVGAVTGNSMLAIYAPVIDGGGGESGIL